MLRGIRVERRGRCRANERLYARGRRRRDGLQLRTTSIHFMGCVNDTRDGLCLPLEGSAGGMGV